MSYEGGRTNLLLMGPHAGISVVTGLFAPERITGAVIVIDVQSVDGGSITGLNVRLRAPSGRKEGAVTDYKVIYALATLGIVAKGVYPFLIYPGGTENVEGWSGVIDGVLPPGFEIEIVKTDTITFQLDAIWIP